MSKSLAAVLGIVLALAGFALGRSMRPGSAGGTATPAERPPDRISEARQTQAPTGDSGGAVAGSISEALQVQDPIARTARLAALLETLGPEAEGGVREILLQPRFDYGMAELELLVRFWARHDPKAAVDWSLSAAPPGCPTASVTPSVEAWAASEPRAVVESLRTTLSGPEGRPVELGLVRGWFASGQPGLVEYLRDMGMSFERQRLIGVLVSLMIERDGPEAVQRWAEGLPDDDEAFKLDVFRQVGTELGAADSEAAVAWCDKHCEGPNGQNVRALIALQWAARDGKAAMEWVGTAPEGQERDYAVTAAYGAWLRRDRDAAVEWVSALGVDAVPPWFLPAIGRYVMAVAQKNASQAVEWAPLIPDEKNRELALITIFKHWRYRDEAAAEEWLARSPLSEEAREKARKRAQTELPSLKPKPPPA